MRMELTKTFEIWWKPLHGWEHVLIITHENN